MSNLTEVKYSHLHNDLFWSVYHHEGEHFEKLRWTGYNDGFWWKNIAPSDKFLIKECKCGKKFKLNIDDQTVTEYNPVNQKILDFMEKQKASDSLLSAFQDRIGAVLSEVVGGYQDNANGREARRKDIMAITELIVTDIVGNFDDEFDIDGRGESKNSLRDEQLKTILGNPQS